MIQYKAKKPEKMEFFVPAGDYELEILEAKETKSKAGNDMIELTLAPIVDGKPGPRLFDYLVFTDKALWKVDEFAASLGLDPGDDLPSAEQLIGMKPEATLSLEEFEGKKQNKVVRYLFDESF